MAKKKRKVQTHKLDMLAPHSGFSSREEMVRAMYDQYQDIVRISRMEKSRAYINTDYDDHRKKRRVKAVLSTMDMVKSKIAPICPDIPAVFNVERDWAAASGTPLNSYDAEEPSLMTMLGAAMWMLDQIRENGKLSEAIESFPEACNAFDEMEMPIVWDFYYDEENLRQMLYLIQNRNADCVGLERTIDAEKSSIKHYLMDLYTAESKHMQDVDSRKRFEAILSYIPDEAKMQAATAYESKFWEWLECYYKSRRIYLREEIIVYEEQQKMLLRYEEIKKELDRQEKNEKNNVLLLRRESQSGDLLHGSVHDPLAKKTMDYFREIHSKETALNKWHDELEAKIDRMKFSLAECCTRPYEWLVKEYGEEFAGVWKEFRIEDPYELCFGFLYLLDNGSDLPWLYFPGVYLMAHYAALLPWPRNSFADRTEHIESRKVDQNVQETQHNLYALSYCAVNAESNEAERFNLAQIVYEKTGFVLPRKIENTTAQIQQGDITSPMDESVNYLISCLEIKRAFEQQKRKIEKERLQGILDDVQVVLPDESKTEKSIEELKAEICGLREEISQLKSGYYMAQRDTREAKIQYDMLEKEVESERKELAVLRELLFQEENQQVEDKPNTSISFPYRTKRRIVVFGGHDSWTREIKPKLPDVRFVDREMLPNVEMIKRADAVWIQHNALAHKFYNAYRLNSAHHKM